MNKLNVLAIILVLFSFPVAYSKTLFEGYFKLELSGKHVGYVVQKYEFLKQSSQYKSTYYVNIEQGNVHTTESIKALANKDFKPHSFQYTFKEEQDLGGKKPNKTSVKVIDARFKGLNMTAITSDGVLKKGTELTKKQLTLKIKKDSILSTFLIQNILAKGLKNKTDYPYSAVAEEDGNLYSGYARIEGTQKFMGKNLYKVKNNFKNSSFTSLMDSFGHVYTFESPKIQLKGTLVKQSEEATRGYKFDVKSLKLLFGSVPTGQNNNLNKTK